MQVYDNIFIGDVRTLDDHKFLEKNKIRLIVNACGGEYLTKLNIKTIRATDFYDIADTCIRVEGIIRFTEDIVKKLEIILPIIREESGNILIHCYKGVNRSGLIIAAYLKKYYNFTAAESIQLIKSANDKRGVPTVSNKSFRIILVCI